MIASRQEYIESLDLMAYQCQSLSLYTCFRRDCQRYQEHLRTIEYCSNGCRNSVLYALLRLFRRDISHRGMRSLTPPTNVLDQGLCIVLHPGTWIGEYSGMLRLGDFVHIDAGVKCGGIHIGDRAAIRANAVVNRSFAPDRTGAGIPDSLEIGVNPNNVFSYATLGGTITT